MTGRLFDFISYTCTKKYIFDISTFKDLYLFVNGAFVASIIYDKKEQGFNFFDDYIFNTLNQNGNRINWYAEIYYKCKFNDEKAMDFFDTVFKEFSENQYASHNKDFQYDCFYQNFASSFDFSSMMDLLIKNTNLLSILNIHDFDKFYNGYLFFSIYERDGEFTKKIEDHTFIDFSFENNPITKCIKEDFPILPMYKYSKLINYLMPHKRDLEYFFKLYLAQQG